MSALLEVRGVTKAFPGVVANRDVAFDVAPGEIHALLGENGAGKSTLVKTIYGVQRPDAGGMLWRGRPYAPSSPGEARAAGVGLVFQHFSLFEAMSVTENVALGLPAGERRGLAERIREVSRGYGLPLDPTRIVGDLSVGERQRVEIVRCLLQSPRLLIMDEPTSVLTPQEVETLFATLRALAAEGVAILYISHKLEEIRGLCSRATILRGGEVVATCDPREETARSLAEMMIGRRLGAVAAPPSEAGAVRLALDGLSLAPESAFGTPLREVTLELRAGEILGLAGVAGNGQDELVAALSGERRVAPGMVTLEGRPVGHMGPARRRRLGLNVAPEERLGHAAAPDLSLTDNAFLTARGWREGEGRLTVRGFLRRGAARRFAERVVREFDVRTAGVEHAARSLSGGNLQKYVMGREMLQAPRVLVAAQPTWGVDAGAAQAIREALGRLAAGGCAVLAISQDLDELLEISTRLAVIAGGRVSAPRPAGGTTVEEIGLLMAGADAA
ncbi:MAG TPA: ABC transporter ATP-binding protein [Paracoccaceae bacterium]|nr:ABC transporter ATP-binding protein [Paracoccaceae bacterium]